MTKLLIPEHFRRPRAGSKLHERAEQWEKEQHLAYAVVTVSPDGTINVDFDCEDIKNVGQLDALGLGVANLYEHMKTFRKQRFS